MSSWSPTDTSIAHWLTKWETQNWETQASDWIRLTVVKRYSTSETRLSLKILAYSIFSNRLCSEFRTIHSIFMLRPG
jgi:hypothetical protein